MTEIEQPQIHQALMNVMGAIGSIGKNNTANMGNFKMKFRGIDDFYNKIHPLMIKENIMAFPEVLELNDSPQVDGQNRVSMRVRYTFTHLDGSFVQVTTAGEAMDKGDKATSMAMSQAHKYCLQQVFMVPTQAEGSTRSGTIPASQARRQQAAEEGKPDPTLPPKPKPKPKAEPLMEGKRMLLELVKAKREGIKSDMEDEVWIKKVITEELKKGRIESQKELDQVVKAVNENLYAIVDPAEVPF